MHLNLEDYADDDPRDPALVDDEVDTGDVVRAAGRRRFQSPLTRRTRCGRKENTMTKRIEQNGKPRPKPPASVPVNEQDRTAQDAIDRSTVTFQTDKARGRRDPRSFTPCD